MNKYVLLVISTVLISWGCSRDWNPTGKRGYGLVKSEKTGGPRVIYDVLAKPLPEIPLPNDQATRIDIKSATSRRLNVSLNASTEYERRARAEFNRMDGFGTFAPIFVSFDGLIDLKELDRRHKNDDFRDDAVYVFNVSPSCSRYGEEVALDMGRGRFPITLYNHDNFLLDPQAPGGYRIGRGNPLFDFDNQGTLNNMVFSERNEDRNGNGQLDFGEDLDQDGVLDVANFIDPTACDDTSVERCVERASNQEEFSACNIEHDRCVADNLMTFYERETNTLILRPVWPLQQRCTYAVVLTKRLADERGRAVESPFIGAHPRDQQAALNPIKDLLPRYGLTLDDVAFAWTFTTGSMTADLEALRAGLYGHGPFAELSDNYPVSDLRLWRVGELTEEPSDDNRLGIDGSCSGSAVSVFWSVGMNEWTANLCSLEADNSALGLIIGGDFTAPYLLHDRDGQATDSYPADNDEIWRLDPQTGEIEYGTQRVTFWCGIPRPRAGCEPGNPSGAIGCPPYPTMMYMHGYGSSRGEIISHMGRHAAMGQVLCALDGPGHGKNVATQLLKEQAQFSLARLQFQDYGADSMIDLIIRGRDRDLNNDGAADPGADMWTADLFHTRDMVRQAVLEHMQFIRILRSAGSKLDDDSVLGDVDGDGYPDFGGPKTILGAWGISLGGVISGVLAGAEPSLDAVSPNAGGGGLTDVAVRSTQAGVPDAVVMPMIGPLVAGCLATDEHQNVVTDSEVGSDCLGISGEPMNAGLMRFAFIANDTARDQKILFAEAAGIQVGDRVVLENLKNGERKEGMVNERGYFRLAVASDALDPISRRPILGLTGDEPGPVRFEETTKLGDHLRLTLYRGQSNQLIERIDTFGVEVTFQGTTYPVGAPLVALQEGFGYRRNSPRLRRFFGLAQSGISTADPAVWGIHTFMEPLNTDYDPFGRRGGDTHVLVMPTAGDSNVPVNTGITMGRVSGLFGSWLRDPEKYKAEHGWREISTPDERYGKSIDQFLIDTWSVEAIWRLQRYADNPINPNVIFDPDNVSDGDALFSCGNSDWSGRNGENRCPSQYHGPQGDCEETSDCGDEHQRCVNNQCEYFFRVPNPGPGKALRINRPRDDGTHDSFRLPVLRPAGQHGIYNAQPFRLFDADAYMVNFTLRFLGTQGREVEHEKGCDCVASRVPEIYLGDTPTSPSLTGRRMGDEALCTVNDLKVCSETCAARWGIVSPERAICAP